MWWFLTLADSTRPFFGLFETVGSLQLKNMLFEFVVLGIVPGTNFQIDFYGITFGLVILLAGLVVAYTTRILTKVRHSRTNQLELASTI